ncbi:hypothetical protein BDZ97DRAFT_1835338 [Flammula alnicola]|nr:hypothetical protein BDZ97DRAFT_1835338 [Flammula alnicola]
MEHGTVAKRATLRSRTAERKIVGDNGENRAQKNDGKQEELSQLTIPPSLLLRPAPCSRPSHQHPPVVCSSNCERNR